MPLPAFTRSRPSSSRPWLPVGLASASDLALQRGEKDRFRFQVYQYEDRHMIRNVVTLERRLPSAEVKERLMGYDAGYSAAALKHSGSDVPRSALAHDDTRHSLLGNSFCCPVVAWLCARGLALTWPACGVAPWECLEVGVAEKPWSSCARFRPAMETPP